MKLTRRAPAFTLVELITVIAIIAILMALLLPWSKGAITAAHRAKASTVVKDVVVANVAYQSDYGRFPAIPGAEDAALAASTYGDTGDGKCKMDNHFLFDVLRAIARPGEPSADDALNPRHVIYFPSDRATASKPPRGGFADGSEFQPNQYGQLLDPWGAQYCIALETDGDTQLDLSSFYSDLAGPQNIVHASAAAWSLGTDSLRGGPGYAGQTHKPNSSEPPDDILSWR